MSFGPGEPVSPVCEKGQAGEHGQHPFLGRLARRKKGSLGSELCESSRRDQAESADQLLR